MPNLLKGTSSHASTQLYANYISVSKSWDPDADSWPCMRDSLTSESNPGGSFLAIPSSTQRRQLCFFIFLLFLPLLCTWSSNWLICKWTYGLVAWGTSCCRAWHHLERTSNEVHSKYASVHAYCPMLTSSSLMCGIWSLNRSMLTAELCPSVHWPHAFSTWIYQWTSGGSSVLVLRRVILQISHQ